MWPELLITFHMLFLLTDEYGLSTSNHIDGALVPTKSLWTPKTDLAELFSKLGLGKYTDLFQQQEVRIPC